MNPEEYETINPQDYEVIKTEKKEHEFKHDRAKQIYMRNQNIKVDKLESIPFNISNQTIKDMLFMSNFSYERQKLGRLISSKGKAALAPIPFRETYVIKAASVVDFDGYGKWLNSITVQDGELRDYLGQKYPLNTEYVLLTNKTVRVQRFIDAKVNQKQTKLFYTSESKILEIDEIPVELFLNNDLGLDDFVKNGIWESLIDLDIMAQEQIPEFRRSRTLPVYNDEFSDDDKEEKTKDLDTGEIRYVEENSYAAKLGSGTSMQPATQATTVLQAQLLTIEDNILTALGLAKDTTKSGSNNGNFEIVFSNEYGIEGLLNQREQREKHYNNFFRLLCKLLSIEVFEVKLELSKIADSKLKLLDAAIMEAEIKGKNLASQDKAAEGSDEDGEQ